MQESRDALEIVIHSVAQALGIDRARIRPESLLMADLQAQSIDFIRITIEVESRTGKTLDLVDFFEKVSRRPAHRSLDIQVEEFARYVARLLSEKA